MFAIISCRAGNRRSIACNCAVLHLHVPIPQCADTIFHPKIRWPFSSVGRHPPPLRPRRLCVKGVCRADSSRRSWAKAEAGRRRTCLAEVNEGGLVAPKQTKAEAGRSRVSVRLRPRPRCLPSVGASRPATISERGSATRSTIGNPSRLWKLPNTLGLRNCCGSQSRAPVIVSN